MYRFSTDGRDWLSPDALNFLFGRCHNTAGRSTLFLDSCFCTFCLSVCVCVLFSIIDFCLCQQKVHVEVVLEIILRLWKDWNRWWIMKPPPLEWLTRRREGLFNCPTLARWSHLDHTEMTENLIGMKKIIDDRYVYVMVLVCRLWGPD